MSLFWSTTPEINQLYSTSLRSSTIKSIEVDENEDGLTDRIELNLLIPLSDNERITSLDGLIFSEIKIQQKARYLFDAVSHVSIRSAGEGMSQISVDGNVVIRQAVPFIARGGYDSTLCLSSNSLISTLSVSLSLSKFRVSLF
jgi:hypothetical protein